MNAVMNECGVGNYINKPTLVWADNKQANNLCNEDIVTAGNMYFRTGYHYNKEAADRHKGINWGQSPDWGGLQLYALFGDRLGAPIVLPGGSTPVWGRWQLRGWRSQDAAKKRQR